LEKGGSMVLSEAAPDLAASEGAATDDLGGETGSGKGRGRRGTGRGRSFGITNGHLLFVMGALILQRVQKCEVR